MILRLFVTGVLLWTVVSSTFGAERGRLFAGARQGPWIVYRYPLFREGNRPPEARRYSQDYYWPANANERYPKFYGGFHSRYFDEIGRPSGDIGLRGYAW